MRFDMCVFFYRHGLCNVGRHAPSCWIIYGLLSGSHLFLLWDISTYINGYTLFIRTEFKTLGISIVF